MRVFGLFLLILAQFSLIAEARVFSYKKEGVAAYFRGTGQLSQLGGSAFKDSNETAVDVSGSVPYHLGGEIGVLFSIGESILMRLGVEAIRPASLEVKGKDSGAAELYTLTSEAFLFHPKLTIEYIYSQIGNIRFIVFAGMGYADVTVDNAYVMTAAGDAFFTPETTHTEKMGGTTYSGFGGLAIETHFVDAVTMSLDFGYLYLPVNKLKYKADVVTFSNNTAVKGSEVVNMDGALRKMDFGGVFAGLSFRFYIDI